MNCTPLIKKEFLTQKQKTGEKSQQNLAKNFTQNFGKNAFESKNGKIYQKDQKSRHSPPSKTQSPIKGGYSPMKTMSPKKTYA